jgi:hypothetical protein
MALTPLIKAPVASRKIYFTSEKRNYGQYSIPV